MTPEETKTIAKERQKIKSSETLEMVLDSLKIIRM